MFAVTLKVVPDKVNPVPAEYVVSVLLSVEDIVNYFPPYKVQYFGNIQVAGLPLMSFHKFSLAPLIPTVHTMDSNLGKLHDMMMGQQIDYVTFESGSKASYLTNDGEVNNLFATKEEKSLNEEAIITANPIYLNYLKEVTVINDKLKNVIPIATQTRFVIYDNLFDNGKLINEKNRPLINDYNTNVENLTELYKQELLDEIGFVYEDGKYVGNLKRFVEVIRDELGKRKVVGGQEDLILEVAAQLKGDGRC